jgi:hypothetical protein
VETEEEQVDNDDGNEETDFRGEKIAEDDV